MKKLDFFDLSILIPARNEMFLKRTVEDILENIRGHTQIIVVADGNWPVPPIDIHPRVDLIHVEESIGQRAATNMAARMSNAKYVMKCDAHCSFGEGFDVIMMEDMQDDWTLIPKMYNLHAFDWVCVDCGHRIYMGPHEPCEKCGGKTEMDMIWRAKPSPETTAMLFDKDLRFGYWGKYKSVQGTADHVETMSLLGACWMTTQDKFWELEMCDEKHGSWGQMGTEVACKTWLSGGKLIVTKRTWFAHMFRTRKDFGFPYPNPGISKARRYSRELWLNDRWDKAKYPLSWLLNKFGDVPGWDFTKGFLYYTDNRLDENIMRACQNQLQECAGENPIVSVSLEPIDFGDNIHLQLERGPLTLFKQILAGLEALDTDIVFLCEHDMLYHPSHFDFIPTSEEKFYYNTNVWKVRLDDGHAVRVDFCQQTSGLCARRDLLVEHYRKRVQMVEEGSFTRKMGFEPGTHGRNERVDDYKAQSWESEYPIIDIRHDQNFTPSRWSPDQFRNKRYTEGWTESDSVPGWGQTKGNMDNLIANL
ncbi:MAG: glycosyltransferase family 2 protein [Planctomycetota bacterium]|jgi:glycosyltransferase involved in cell wall biosynthesis